jgi:hypothetical protein
MDRPRFHLAQYFLTGQDHGAGKAIKIGLEDSRRDFRRRLCPRVIGV